jgi:hypothetical protein
LECLPVMGLVENYLQAKIDSTRRIANLGGMKINFWRPFAHRHALIRRKRRGPAARLRWPLWTNAGTRCGHRVATSPLFPGTEQQKRGKEVGGLRGAETGASGSAPHETIEVLPSPFAGFGLPSDSKRRTHQGSRMVRLRSPTLSAPARPRREKKERELSTASAVRIPRVRIYEQAMSSGYISLPRWGLRRWDRARVVSARFFVILRDSARLPEMA